jgi:hypothetical protein
VVAVTLQENPTMYIIDVSQASKLLIANSIVLTASQVVAMDNYLYVRDYAHNLLLIYDLTTPNQPMLLSSVSLSTPITLTISSDNKAAFVGAVGGTYFIDISNSQQPTLQWNFLSGGMAIY